MSNSSWDSVTVESKVISYTFNKGDYNPANNNKWYYKLESTISGTNDNKTINTKIFRKYNVGDEWIEIGTLNKNKIVLNNKARNNEKKELSSFDENHLWPATIKGTLGNDLLKKINSKSDLNLTEKEKKVIKKDIKGSNNAPNPGGEDDTGGGNGVKPDFNFDIEGINSSLTNINIEGRQFRDTYKNLHYPEGLGSNRQDRIRFTQKYTQGRKVNVSFDSNLKVFQRDPEIKIDGSVTLPIVTEIGDRNAVDWKDESLNPIQALAAGGAVSVFEGIRKNGVAQTFKDAQGMFQSAQGDFAKNADVGSDMAKAINVYLAQQAVGAQGLLSRATGAILNPNLEMLFGGPKLRSFGFTFKLSPRDASEASQVRQIIRFFKQGMSVKTSSSNVFLKTPNVFDIQYQTFNTDGNLIEHPSINFIKTCALTSCDVQYTPDGTYMTYEDPFRTMTSYQLTLNFGELDPIFDDDYTELDDDNDQVLGY